MSLFARTLILINFCLTLALTLLMSVLLVQKADYRTHFRRAGARVQIGAAELKRARQDTRAQTRGLRRQIARRRRTLSSLSQTHAATRQLIGRQRQTQAALSPELAGLERSHTGLQQRVARINRRKAALERDLARARAERETAVANRGRLLQERSQADAQFLAQREKVNALRKAVIELADNTQQLRRIVEIIKEEHFGVEWVELVPPLDGLVQGVAGDLVRIDRGRDDGVEIGFPFSVVRGKTYIGYLRIVEVRKESATARIVKNMSPDGLTVRQGDRVTTRIK